MKCPNCGANYSFREKACPYCQTINTSQVDFAKKKEQVDQNYDKTQKEMRGTVTLFAIDRVVTVALHIATGVLVAMMLFAIILIFAENKIHTFRYEKKVPEYEKTMEQLYQQGDYRELASFMHDHIEDYTRYPLYKEITLIITGYDRFQEAKLDLALLNSSREDWKEVMSWRINKLLDEGLNLLAKQNALFASDEVIWDDTKPQLEEYMNELNRDVKRTLIYMLQIPETEIDEICSSDYVYYSDIQELSQRSQQQLKSNPYQEDVANGE